MSEPKFTPGPWTAFDPMNGYCGHDCTPEGCFGDHPVGICQVAGPEQDGSYFENSFDAHVIAAAPAMYAELAGIAPVLLMIRQLLPHPDTALLEQAQRIETLLAQARGEAKP